MKRILICSILIAGFTISAFANHFDTGWKKFKQPDGTTFIGRQQGDEYEYQFLTKEGFPFEINIEDGYYYYANGVKNNRYNLSHLKVGINNPVNIPGNLRIKTSKRKPAQATGEMTSIPQTTTNTTYTLKVLLVDFADVKGSANYKISDFENMFSGSNYTQSPDGDLAFGSMSNYYEAMSNGNVSINAIVVNDTISNDMPEWIHMYSYKMYYRNCSTKYFMTTAHNIATAQGLDLSVDATTKLVYIYAGNRYLEGLNPAVDQIGGDKYIMSEKWGGPGTYDLEDPSYKFSHIGVHCHEFGHLLGYYDLYNGTNKIYYWCLMADGCDNARGACPSPINPHNRYIKGWINAVNPPVPNTGLQFPYNEITPTVYKFESGDDIYYVEYRKYEDFSQYLPGHDDGPGGILVWHVKNLSVDLIEADGSGYGNGGDEGYGDMWPGSTNNRSLNDFTTPNSNLWYGGNSNIILHNISNPGSTMTATFGDKWFGEIPTDLVWGNNIELGGNINVPSGVSLTIQAGTEINFNNNCIYTNGGTITLSGSLDTDIRLTRSGNIVGLYPSLASAVSNAQTGDRIDVNTDISLSDNLVSNLDIDLYFAENISVNLDGHYISLLNGEIHTYLSTNFESRHIELHKINGSIRTGIFSDLQSALNVNNIAYRIVYLDSDTLSSNMTIPMDIRVMNAYTLTISGGTTLLFNPDVRLEIFGELKSIGNSANKIIFDRYGSTGFWDGIYVGNGTTGGTLTMNYCYVYRADNGIYLDANSYGNIYHSEFKYNNIGVYSRMGAVLNLNSNSSAQNSNLYGIRTHSCNDVNLSWSRSNNYNCTGLYATDGDGHIRHCWIKGNYIGIAAGTQLLDLGTNCNWDIGNNDFSSNRNLALSLTQGDVDTYVDAYGNYWQGSGWYIPSGPTVNRGCDLTSPVTNNSGNDLSVQLTNTGVKNQLLMAKQLKGNGNFQEAYSIFKELLSSDDLTLQEQSSILHYLYSTHERWKNSKKKSSPTDDMGHILQDLIIKNGSKFNSGYTELYKTALNLMMNYQIRQGSIDTAIELSKQIVQEFPNSIYEEMRLCDLVYFYLRCKNDNDNAEKYFSELIAKYPDSKFTEEAKDFFRIFKSTEESTSFAMSHQDNLNSLTEIPTSWKLEPNFPNPFNPCTEIHYSIPEASNMKIEIYNSLGQCVHILVDDYKEPGNHVVTWRADNLPSGMYFVKMSSPKFSQVRKALLLK